MNPPAPPAGNDDELLLSSLKQQIGRAKGQPNFRGDEDVMLASAYVVVTTNAAIGTDQNGATFWEKIRVSFLQRGGNAGRNACSLQNQFNKVLQMEVNKYIGLLMSVLCEYHSGWVLDDYVNDAKRKFLVKFGKGFKHEMVYNVLKKSGLPKYEINMATIDSRVRRALFFCDNDNAVPVGVDGEGGDIAVARCPSGGMGMCTPRPSIGKRKRKPMSTIASSRCWPPIQKQKTEAELANANIIAERNSCRASLVASSKMKNDLVQQQFAYQLFMQTPDAVESQAFFAAMRKKYSSNTYMAAVVEEEVAVVEFVESVEDDDADADRENDDDDDDEVVIQEEEYCEEHFDELGRWVPGGYRKDTVLEDHVAQQRGSQPVICLHAMTSCEVFSQGTPPPLPSTQNLLAALQSYHDVDDVEDTQLTTLSN
ncbi:No apical meristem-associated C-terminal domain [Fragilaria crotonensis]|nr:No apical meristem-associated C-terminal domain [Fragilaria crotonensis]